METMEMLWSYMQEDMKADRINSALKNSPLRQKLEKDPKNPVRIQTVWGKGYRWEG